MGQTASEYAGEEDDSTNYTDSDEELLVSTDFCGSDGEEEDESYYEEEEEEKGEGESGDENEKYVENPRDLPADDLRSHPGEEDTEENVNGEAGLNDIKKDNCGGNNQPTEKQPQDLPQSHHRILSPDDITLNDVQNITLQDLRKSKPGKDVIESFDLDGHLPAITFILSQSKEISKAHFALVPARMNEQKFFATLFYVLQQRIKGETMDKEKGEDAFNANGDSTTNQQPESPVETNSTPRRILFSNMHNDNLQNKNVVDENAEELKKKLDKAAKENANLRKMLHETQRKLEVVEAELASVKLTQIQQQHEQQQIDSSTSESAENEKEEEQQQKPHDPKTVHKGTWIIDKDSREFLELDDELKSNLRAEKEKRLQDVRNQMKFILDSDDIRHSFGEWDCCGKKDYHADSCA